MITRRCRRPCAGRTVCAAFTSSTLGSRPPPQSESTDGGEGARGGFAGPGDAAWPLGHPSSEGEALAPVPSAERPWPEGGGAGGRSRVSRGEKPGRGKQLVPVVIAWVNQGSASDTARSHCVLSSLVLTTFLWDRS